MTSLLYRLRLSGIVDILTHDVLWEIKCKSSLEGEDELQLACYAWLLHREARNRGSPLPPGFKFRLLNVLTGEEREIGPSVDEVGFCSIKRK